MNTELFTLITPIATFVTVLVGFIAIIKFLFSINDRITKLEIETKTGFEKINSKLEGKEIQITTTNKRIDKLESDFKEQRTEFKELINKVLDVLPKAAL